MGTLGAAALAVAAAVGVDEAAGQRRPDPTVESVALENAQALKPLRKALRELRAGDRQRVRVVHWGDSNVAAGIWAQRVRAELHRRFGDGGPGYLVPRFGTHDDSDVIRASTEWKARRKGFDGRFGPADGRWGLAGVAAEGRGRGAWVKLRTPPYDRGGRFEVHALAHPKGGKLQVRIDEGEPDEVSTEAAGHGLTRRRWTLEPGAHELEVRGASWRAVRLLGLVLERRDPGVVYDVLGINGHRASALLEWDVELLRAQLDDRKPQLVVLSYGGNEALDPNISPQAFERQLSKVLRRVRRLVPGASILLVGPIAMCPQRPPLTKLHPELPAMIDAQRRVAKRFGAAFWDSSRVSGGPHSLCAWRRHRKPALVSGDNLHLTREGYEVVGRKFAEALLEGL